MIELLQRSTSIRIPTDQKVAHAALRFLGACLAGTAGRLATDDEKLIDKARAELFRLEAALSGDDKHDPIILKRIAAMHALIREYEGK